MFPCCSTSQRHPGLNAANYWWRRPTPECCNLHTTTGKQYWGMDATLRRNHELLGVVSNCYPYSVIFTTHQRNLGKVIFSQVFFCPGGGLGIPGPMTFLGGWYLWFQVYSEGISATRSPLGWVCPGVGSSPPGYTHPRTWTSGRVSPVTDTLWQPPHVRSPSGWYASSWNAFLLDRRLHRNCFTIAMREILLWKK